jgi:hypothetical protein
MWNTSPFCTFFSKPTSPQDLQSVDMFHVEHIAQKRESRFANALNVPCETHLRFAQQSGIDFINAFAYSGPQHFKKKKSWDV